MYSMLFFHVGSGERGQGKKKFLSLLLLPTSLVHFEQAMKNIVDFLLIAMPLQLIPFEVTLLICTNSDVLFFV